MSCTTKCKICTFVGVFISVSFLFTTYTGILTTIHVLLPQCSTIEEVIDGKWVLREDLTHEEIEERKRIDAGIRVAMGWASSMFRNDSRCGKKHLIPGYRLLGQCDPESDSPCCNGNTGTCGNGRRHCDCDNCTDSRLTVPAELANWLPNTCRLREFSHEDVCELLHKFNIYFVGDSLIRQLHTILILMLTDDFNEGSFPKGVEEKDKELCRGEHQLTMRRCSMEIAIKKLSELENTSICNGKSNIHIDVIEDYERELNEESNKTFESLLSKENSWIICSVGYHYQIVFDDVKNKYLDKLWEKLQRSTNNWPKIIWVGLHGLDGFLRQVQLPLNAKLKDFNSKVQDYWSKRSITTIDTYPLSDGIKSYDGRHYGFGLNKLKMNIILDIIQRYYEGRVK